MVRNSELVICNRCDGIEDLERYKRMLMSMNTKCEIVFEDENGEIDEISEEDLPYDLNAPVVKISPEAYGIWYIDCMDKPERYVGKVVEFTAMVLKSPEFPKNYFVPGRMAMTCCADDMAFLGFVCVSGEAEKFRGQDWVKVTARVEKEFWADYGGEGPVLHATSVLKAKAPKDKVISFV